MTHTITTHWHTRNRVSFSHHEGSFGIEDLELLEAAIKHARRRLAEMSSAPPHQDDPPTHSTLSQADVEQLYSEQLQRQAAPT